MVTKVCATMIPRAADSRTVQVDLSDRPDLKSRKKSPLKKGVEKRARTILLNEGIPTQGIKFTLSGKKKNRVFSIEFEDTARCPPATRDATVRALVANL